MSRRITLIVSMLLAGAALPARAEPGDSCAGQVKDVPIAKVVASAGAFANYRNAEGSISFESNEIFLKARERADSLPSPGAFCGPGCAPAPAAVLVFRSAPRKVLTEYKDAPYCEMLQKTTTRTPLRYLIPVIHTVEELNEWIGDLSRGRSDAGEDLYERCDRSCSPRYEYAISQNRPGPGYAVVATVICGPARDKGDGMYDLEAFFRWSCRPAENAAPDMRR